KSPKELIHARFSHCPIYARPGIRRAASRGTDRKTPRLLPDLHRPRPVASRGRTLDGLDRGLSGRNDVAISSAGVRFEVARAGRALFTTFGTPPARPQSSRPWVHFPEHISALVRTDKRAAFARCARPGRSDVGDAVSGEGTVSMLLCRARFALHRH